MSGSHWAFAVLMLISLVPDTSEACLFCRGGRRGLFDRCGVGAPCGAPCGDCCAPMLPPSPCFTPVQPCLVPQQVTTYRDVPQTCYRQEPVCTTVPVTTCRQVTVDEGCFQKIWVPRMVTKSVPQTVYQQQVSYRTVPVTTMTRVPVTETHMVPVMPSCPPTFAAPGCSAPCSGGMMIPGDIPGLAPATPVPYGMPEIPGASSVPQGSSPPSLPPVGLGIPSGMYNPPSASGPSVPVPNAADPGQTRTSSTEEWSNVERRAAFFQQEFGYRPFGNRVQQAGFTR